MKRIITIFALLTVISATAQESKFIHIDQFGYLPQARKVAVIADPQVGFNSHLSIDTPGIIELRKASDDAVMASYTAQIWNGGELHNSSGDRGWWVDFSGFTTTGEYYFFDQNSEETSHVFQIDENVYAEAMKHALRMFFYNRCNLAKEEEYAGAFWVDDDSFLQDAECRSIQDPENPELLKDLSGGWFDAGDYNKYVTFAYEPVHDLLSAFEENPEVFTDDIGIPESGNGYPDILDEVMWELEWLLKMNNEDGTTHIKMGSIDYDQNALSPPSLNNDPRYYGPVCSSASIAVASMFAHAALVLGDIASLTEYAQMLEERAVSAFEWAKELMLTNSLMANCDDGTILAGDADWSVYDQQNNIIVAAIYLFELTGDEEYKNFIGSFYSSTEPIFNDYWGPYRMPLNDALLRYAANPNADDQVASLIQTSFLTFTQNNSEGYIGFNEDDLYRAFMPTYSYHWGSNKPRSHYGVLNKLVVKYGFSGWNLQSQHEMASAQLHWLHGVNPLGLCMLTNMYNFGGDHCVNEIYHTWFQDGSDFDHALESPFGPPPGYLTGGPNSSFSVADLSPPSGQPDQKSYLDFNDDWPNNSWEISEPAIYYQAAYIRLLAWINQSNTTTSVNVYDDHSSWTVYPNPSSGEIRLITNQSGPVEVFSIEGKSVLYQLLQPNAVLDLSPLNSGIYLVQFQGESQRIILKN